MFSRYFNLLLCSTASFIIYYLQTSGNIRMESAKWNVQKINKTMMILHSFPFLLLLPAVILGISLDEASTQLLLNHKRFILFRKLEKKFVAILNYEKFDPIWRFSTLPFRKISHEIFLRKGWRKTWNFLWNKKFARIIISGKNNFLHCSDKMRIDNICF